MMSFQAVFYTTTLLTVLLAVPGLIKADDRPASDSPAGDGQKSAVMDVRALLEKGQASKTLPEGIVVRISACLGELDEDAPGKELPEQLRETWEFTSKQVRRVLFEEDEDKRTVERYESRPFDSKGLCKDLLEGKAIEIQARKGKGAKVAFAGSRYRRGGRSIEVLLNSQSILHLYETNGPFLELYAETDARAFGALYDRLASQAHREFQSKTEDAK